MPTPRKRPGNPSGRPPRPRATPSGRRDRILAAARALFCTRGYAGTTPEAVAEAAKVKPATLARHFPRKADLFAGLYDQFHAAAFEPPDGTPGPDSLAFWLALPDRFDRVAEEYRDVVGLVLRGPAEADPNLTAAIGAGLGRTADALVGLIRAGQAAGMVRRGIDPARAAWEWVRWLFGGLLLRPADAGPAPPDDDLPPQPADCLLHGLLKTDV
jgi:AcrR family transcriptional regulator